MRQYPGDGSELLDVIVAFHQLEHVKRRNEARPRAVSARGKPM